MPVLMATDIRLSDELKRDAPPGCGDELRDDTALDPRTPSSRRENGHAMVVSKTAVTESFVCKESLWEPFHRRLGPKAAPKVEETSQPREKR